MRGNKQKSLDLPTRGHPVSFLLRRPMQQLPRGAIRGRRRRRVQQPSALQKDLPRTPQAQPATSENRVLSEKCQDPPLTGPGSRRYALIHMGRTKQPVAWKTARSMRHWAQSGLYRLQVALRGSNVQGRPLASERDHQAGPAFPASANAGPETARKRLKVNN